MIHIHTQKGDGKETLDRERREREFNSKFGEKSKKGRDKARERARIRTSTDREQSPKSVYQDGQDGTHTHTPHIVPPSLSFPDRERERECASPRKFSRCWSAALALPACLTVSLFGKARDEPALTTNKAMSPPFPSLVWGGFFRGLQCVRAFGRTKERRRRRRRR